MIGMWIEYVNDLYGFGGFVISCTDFWCGGLGANSMR